MLTLLSSSPSVTDSVKPTESPPWQQGVLAFTDRLSVGALIEVTEADALTSSPESPVAVNSKV